MSCIMSLRYEHEQFQTSGQGRTGPSDASIVIIELLLSASSITGCLDDQDHFISGHGESAMVCLPPDSVVHKFAKFDCNNNCKHCYKFKQIEQRTA